MGEQAGGPEVDDQKLTAREELGRYDAEPEGVAAMRQALESPAEVPETPMSREAALEQTDRRSRETMQGIVDSLSATPTVDEVVVAKTKILNQLARRESLGLARDESYLAQVHALSQATYDANPPTPMFPSHIDNAREAREAIARLHDAEHPEAS